MAKPRATCSGGFTGLVSRVDHDAVYRTWELGQWSANAPRLAQRLVRDGQLVQLAHGLFAAPRRSRFGEVPPTDEALLRGFLDGEPFVFTGPERWNTLGLGTTAVFATPLAAHAGAREGSARGVGAMSFVHDDPDFDGLLQIVATTFTRLARLPRRRTRDRRRARRRPWAR